MRKVSFQIKFDAYFLIKEIKMTAF
jgi:hypothetical protein